MPDYRRFIAYFYEYIDGKRQKNAGFVKAEQRNGVWRLNLQLKGRRWPEDSLRIFGYGLGEAVYPVILLGKGYPRKDCMTQNLQFRAESVRLEGRGFEELAGMWIPCGEGRCFLSYWKEGEADVNCLILPERCPEKAETHMRGMLEAAEVGMEEERKRKEQEDAEAAEKAQQETGREKMAQAERAQQETWQEKMAQAERAQQETGRENTEQTERVRKESDAAEKALRETELTEVARKEPESAEKELRETELTEKTRQKSEAVEKELRETESREKELQETEPAEKELQKTGQGETEREEKEHREIKQKVEESERKEPQEIEREDVRSEGKELQETGLEGVESGREEQQEAERKEAESGEEELQKIKLEDMERAERVAQRIERADTGNPGKEPQEISREAAAGREQKKQPEINLNQVNTGKTAKQQQELAQEVQELETGQIVKTKTEEERRPEPKTEIHLRVGSGQDVETNAAEETEPGYTAGRSEQDRPGKTEGERKPDEISETEKTTGWIAEIGQKAEQEVRKKRMEGAWKTLRTRCQPVAPFGEGIRQEWIRICPREVMWLEQQHWPVGRNSFLMQGFLQYRHLLLGREGMGRYVLAVPGKADNQTAYTARAFGFTEYRQTPSSNTNQRMGYWCRRIEADAGVFDGKRDF